MERNTLTFEAHVFLFCFVFLTTRPSLVTSNLMVLGDDVYSTYVEPYYTLPPWNMCITALLLGSSSKVCLLTLLALTAATACVAAVA